MSPSSRGQGAEEGDGFDEPTLMVESAPPELPRDPEASREAATVTVGFASASIAPTDPRAPSTVAPTNPMVPSRLAREPSTVESLDAVDDETVVRPGAVDLTQDEPLDIELSDDDVSAASPEPAATPASSSMTAADGFPRPFASFTLLKPLGEGGMAEVFLARRDGPLGFQRTLVVKRIHPQLSLDGRFVQMFLREARLAARLQHRNIVRIEELGDHEGMYFMAMEYIDGITLHQLAKAAWCNAHSLPLELAVAAAADAAAALHYAHAVVDDDGVPQRIVHRDVSPDNLMIDRAGDTKLLDFGIAKAAGSVSLTQAGEVKGKLPYMSPEQLLGKELDGRSDLYSLGATLFWLTTGRRPFQGTSEIELMHAITQQEPPTPSALNPAVPAVLDALILRLLSKRPADRYADGLEVADELNALLPPSRREIGEFVVELMRLTRAPDAGPFGELSVAAATPRTPYFVTESRRRGLTGTSAPRADLSTAVTGPSAEHAPREFASPLGSEGDGEVKRDGAVDPRAAIEAVQIPAERAEVTPLLRRSMRPVLVAAGGTGLLVGLLLWSSSTPEEAVAPPPLPALPVGEALPPPPPPVEDAPQNSAASAVDTTAPGPPAEERPGVDTPAVNTDPLPAEPTAAAEETAEPDPPPSSAGKTVRVTAEGPATVVWRHGQTTLGRGNASFDVPAGVTSLTAFHRARKASTNVAIEKGKVSFDRAPKGTLDIRVFPHAVVYAGSEKVWEVGAGPAQLPAGTYKLRFESQGRTKEQTVTVTAGATAKVRVNMNQ